MLNFTEVHHPMPLNLGNEVPWHYEVGDGGSLRLV